MGTHRDRRPLTLALSPWERETGGGIRSAPRVPAAMVPKAAGTRRADRRRETRAAEGRTARVTAARRAAGSLLEESRRVASGGEQAPSGRAPAGQKISLYAVKNRKLGFAGDDKEVAGAGEPGVEL